MHLELFLWENAKIVYVEHYSSVFNYHRQFKRSSVSKELLRKHFILIKGTVYAGKKLFHVAA